MINELLNKESQEHTSSKVMIVPLEDIHPNPLNRAPIVHIDELASLIQEDGLTSPLLAYKKANHEYVLIGGERRLTALQLLGHEDVPVIVIQKPKTELEERLLILDANAQREETDEYKTSRAKEYAELFVISRKEGKIASGLLKRDWIGKHMNLSGRQVQRYLSESMEEEIKTEHGHDVHVERKEADANKEIRKVVKQVEKLQQIEIDAFIKDGNKINYCEQLIYIRDSIDGLIDNIRQEKNIDRER